MHKLAVYGTLRSKDSWSGVLSTQIYLGKGLLPNNIAIHDLGGYPAVRIIKGVVDKPTICEVYEIDDVALARCDQIEGHPNFYERRLVDIDGYGDCLVYFLDDCESYPRIISGDWFDK